MSKPRLVNVWTLTLNLNTSATDATLIHLDEKIQDVSDRAAYRALVLSREPFIWQRRGAVLTVHAQGDSDLLIEIGQWALDEINATGFEISRSISVPLRLKEGWKGYDGH